MDASFSLFRLFTKRVKLAVVFFPNYFTMYYSHLILIIAHWTSLSLSAASENLFLNNPDDLLWDPNSAIDNIDSGLDMMKFDDDASSSPIVDPISFLQDDDDQTLFANTPSQSPCDAAAAAGEATDFTLVARDNEHKSCQIIPKGSSSPPPVILSPETIQLFQDPSSLLNNFLSPSSGSEEPPPPDDPNKDPNNPNNPPPGILPRPPLRRRRRKKNLERSPVGFKRYGTDPDRK